MEVKYYNTTKLETDGRPKLLDRKNSCSLQILFTFLYTYNMVLNIKSNELK